jgi:hypothetical protein
VADIVEMNIGKFSPNGADQKQHGKYDFQVVSFPHIPKTLGEVPLGSESSIFRIEVSEDEIHQNECTNPRQFGAIRTEPGNLCLR